MSHHWEAHWTLDEVAKIQKRKKGSHTSPTKKTNDQMGTSHRGRRGQVLNVDVGDWGSIAAAAVEIAEEEREYEHSLEDEAPAAGVSELVDCVRYRPLPYSGPKGVNKKRLKLKILFDRKIAGGEITLA
jgi:hypothetical protein